MDRQCDFCNINKAVYDGKTIRGPWAYMCGYCYQEYGSTTFPPTVLANIKE